MRAAFAVPFRLSWLGWLVALSCSDGSGQADVFATRSAEGGSVAAGGGAAGAGSTGNAGGEAPIAAAGAPQFGSESQGSAGELAAAGQAAMGAGGTEPTPNAGGTAGSGNGSGSAGSLGSAGLAGSGEPPTVDAAARCAEACQTSQDCKIGVSDYGFDCNPLTHRCERLGLPCHAAVECLPGASLWFLGCDSDADCFYFSDDVCVSVAGTGRCARRAPGGASEASGCQEPTPDGVLLPRFGNLTESVLVCAEAGQRCERGSCVPGCQSDAECSPARNGSWCDAASGGCRCATDSDCGGAGVSRCNTSTGDCECSSDRDCEDVPGADVCVEGRCGCSGLAACAGERLFSGTQMVCE